jgi:hypothetical protein
MNDLDLLRQYEPILKFTKGELFFPCAVDEYVHRCSLWLRPPQATPQLLEPVGNLDLVILARYEEIRPHHTLFLQFVQKPLTGIAFQRWLHRKERPRFRSSARLARVGLTTRIVDSGLELSLLLRGKVPGGTVAAAETHYREILAAANGSYVYYGRVLRESGYVILHYLFFYAMNNWRSTFYGVNDHEADWEQVLLYLEEHPNGPPAPAWVAYAAHDFSGDDLRRRWDDPQLSRIGTHPVVYVGAGSHASYFEQGEYLMRAELDFLRPVENAIQNAHRFWTEVLKQGTPQSYREHGGFLSLPFIDYARGDGLTIGPGQMVQWSPVLISDTPAWVENYRGLWGLDTKDPLKGETAPAGPKYNRDGTVRQSWHNPLGWAGLHKIPPSRHTSQFLEEKIAAMQYQLETLEQQIVQSRTELIETGLQVEVLSRAEHLTPLLKHQQEKLIEQEFRLNQLYQQGAALQDTLQAAHRRLADLKSGKHGDPQAHIKHPHHPETEIEARESRLVEMWSAVSTALLLIGFGVLAISGRQNWIAGMILMIVAFAIIESGLRRRLHLLLLNVTMMMAAVTIVILVYEFFWEILFVGILAVARLILIGNLRELRGY